MLDNERQIYINGYHLAAKEWNSGADKKIIACHGWLDNAASFDILAALLPDCHILALDMPGHGKSDHKSQQASYNIWDDLLDILAVADVMGWARFHFVGHSRGAIMGLLLAAAMPDRVSSLIMLDGIIPLPVDVADTASQLRQYLTAQRSLPDKEPPQYDTIEEAIKVRCRASRLSEASARLIVERGIKKEGEVFRWCSDPRLLTPSAFKMTADHNKALLAQLRPPCLLLVAEQGMGAKSEVIALIEAYPQIIMQILPGGHYFHMEEQSSLVAGGIKNFLARI